ncbi:hypothetical protein D3C72_1299360 [compost metagenome]
MDHLLDGGADELGGVQRDLVRHAGREGLGHLVERLAHVVGHLERVGAGLLVDRDDRRRLAVQGRAQHVLLLADLGATHVPQPHDGGARGIGTQDDVLELLGRGQPARRDQRERELHRVGVRRLADAAGAELLVLALHRVLHVLAGDAERRHAVWPQPDAHGEVRRAHDLRLVGAVDALDGVQHVQVRVIVDVLLVEAAIRRIDPDQQQEAGGALLHVDAGLLHRLGQLRQRQVHAVLHLHLGGVRVGADVEVDIERHRPGGR